MRDVNGRLRCAGCSAVSWGRLGAIRTWWSFTIQLFGGALWQNFCPAAGDKASKGLIRQCERGPTYSRPCLPCLSDVGSSALRRTERNKLYFTSSTLFVSQYFGAPNIRYYFSCVSSSCGTHSVVYTYSHAGTYIICCCNHQ